MVFSSTIFLLVFLPIFLLIYAIAPKKLKMPVFVIGNLCFYAYGDWRHMILLVVSAVVNFVLGRLIGGGRSKKEREDHRIFYYIAIELNLAVLIFFKLFGRQIPLGISFYTFQIIAYLTDIYRRELPPERRFLPFCAFITGFPQLISGPLVSYKEVRENLEHPSCTWENLEEGLKVFTLGLVAKVLLADPIGCIWQEIQVKGIENITTPLAWLGAIAFSLKLYFDFYGYSLMAKGLARMLGYSLPDNFDTPYMSCSVREFYRRWHMTLGKWFTKYVYIPMGGSRKGGYYTVRNIAIVWLLTALWHGKTANYLIWGMMLCLLIIMERMVTYLDKRQVLKSAVGRIFGHCYLLAVIPVTWMCFALQDVSQIQIYLGRMFALVAPEVVKANDWLIILGKYWYMYLLGMIGCTPICKYLFDKNKKSIPVSVVLAILFWICVWRIQLMGQNTFMYFSF